MENLKSYWDAAPELAQRVAHAEDAAKAELSALRKDAERYRKLKASGKYCAASFGGGWGLTTGRPGSADSAALDAAADALPAVGAA